MKHLSYYLESVAARAVADTTEISEAAPLIIHAGPFHLMLLACRRSDAIVE